MDAILQAGSDWVFVWDNRWFLFLGTVVTVLLTLTSVVLGILAGFPAAAIEVYGRGRLRSIVSGAGVLLRATPVVVIVVLFFFILPIPSGLPSLPFIDRPRAFIAGMIALGLRSGAYQSQVFRGGIQSVGEGQTEAARSIGLTQLETIRYVVLPQALRRSVPGFQNEFTIVLKDTSVVFAIGLAELLTRGFRLFTQPGREGSILEVILTVALIYFVLTFTTNRALDAVSRAYAIPGGD